MDRASRWGLVLSCVAALAYTLYAYSVSPDVVPVHYTSHGVPDRWGPREDVLLVSGGIIGICSAGFFSLPELFRRAPKSLLPLPHGDDSPERREAATTLFAFWARGIGTAVNVLLVTLQLVLAPSQPGASNAPSPVPSLLVMAFVALTLGSCAALLWSQRLER